jgi:hypothetical protein
MKRTETQKLLAKAETTVDMLRDLRITLDRHISDATLIEWCQKERALRNQIKKMDHNWTDETVIKL